MDELAAGAKHRGR